eukprot:5113727-Pyramimonas_sp.AAC.1
MTRALNLSARSSPRKQLAHSRRHCVSKAMQDGRVGRRSRAQPEWKWPAAKELQIQRLARACPV